mmetsp:Transcript_26717/g.44812  ORF Transcript_26717/g.44812 Transcript_26717/m.44812 type:complete len:577 (-) Transcript_26717:375-2105(-)|eukprot:CAMPEP_0198212652 /NCGR_PEP_ID=MMETSP1445-20131203/27014_1 /TAXON_ID=36898 /ORGANISM="Pyramimonas sp., Strain CCMP2087" /LENGTH=576 /DNA_ID=CAMNT_0043887149 /DNA_START=144 /DNA_END=1874 /DNA_ORIENTATION=-
MALAAERAKYGLPVEFKVTREMKKTFTAQEKGMFKAAYETGGTKRANEVMRVYFAKKRAAIKAAKEAEEGGGASGVPGGSDASASGSAAGAQTGDPVPDDSGKTTRSIAAAAVVTKEVVKPKILTVIPLGETSESGQLLYAGTTDWDNLGKKTAESGSGLWSFHKMLVGVKIRLVASGCGSVHSVCVDEAGALYAWGRNDAGQLGVGDMNSRAAPVKVKGLDDHKIRHASCGKKNTLICTEAGLMFSWGTHKNGQLGHGGKASDGYMTPVQVPNWGADASPVTRVACGAEFCMAVNEEGSIAAWGHPQYGQLGNNANGEYIEKAGSISYHFELSPKPVRFVNLGKAKMVDVACGNNHSVAMSEDGTVFTWGFGGYGRLGHNNQKDLMSPQELVMFNFNHSKNDRLVANSIAAGATCSYVRTNGGQMYFFGRTKSTGEAVMYPKPVVTINGWNVKSFSCGNNSTIVAADSSVITWGPSPSYGELAYGDPATGAPKSCSQPKLVEDLQECGGSMVAAGWGMSMVIVPPSDAAKLVLAKLPEYKPTEVVLINTSPPAPTAAAKKRGGGATGGSGKKAKK